MPSEKKRLNFIRIGILLLSISSAVMAVAAFAPVYWLAIPAVILPFIIAWEFYKK